MIRVRIPPVLRRHTAGASQVEAQGATVGRCLEALERRFPDLSQEMRDETGELRSSVNLYVNGQDVRYLSGLDTSLKSGDELAILVAIAGGETRQLRAGGVYGRVRRAAGGPKCACSAGSGPAEPSIEPLGGPDGEGAREILAPDTLPGHR